MTTPLRPRPLRVLVVCAVIGAGIVLAGVLLALVTRTITGSLSPLPATPPWSWSLDDIARWFSTDATSASAVDVAVRLLATVAWLALAVIAANLLRELAHQARHGVALRRPPAPANVAAPLRVGVRQAARDTLPPRHGFAATLIALLLGGSTLVAGTATALPARAPVAVEVADTTPAPDNRPIAFRDDEPVGQIDLDAGWQWGSHTVTSAHESLASIAQQVGDDPMIARAIWEANRGHDMGAGHRFTDPAVIKAGWTLRVPAPTPPAAPMHAVQASAEPHPPPTSLAPEGAPANPAGEVPVSHIVTVEPGDTLWQQIDRVVSSPTQADVVAVALANNGATTPGGPWVFRADNPHLIHPGMVFDLQPAIDLHDPPADPAESPATPQPLPPPNASPFPALDPPEPGPDSGQSPPDVPAGTTPAPPAGPGAGPAIPAAAGTPAGSGLPAAPAATETASPVPTPTGDVPAVPFPAVLPTPFPAAAGPAAQPGDVAATPPPTASDPESGGKPGPGPIVALAAAGMTIAGLVASLDRRRRRRQAHLSSNRAVALPVGSLADSEQVVRAAARLDRAARVNGALRHLSPQLAGRATVLRARYILVDDDHVTVVLSHPAAAPEGWEAVEGPDGWRCVLDDTALTYAADVHPHPWPAVVPLGVTVDTDIDLLVDLEALGITALVGPAAEDVCAAIICAIGATTTDELVTVIDDGGVALHGLDRHLSNRIELTGLHAVLERLEGWAEPFRFETKHLLAQRHDDPGQLEPCVAAVLAPIDDPARTRLRALSADGTRPIAVITTDPSVARTIIETDEYGVATFDSHMIRCHRLTPTVADTTRELIDQAATAPTVPTHAVTDATAGIEQPSLFPPNHEAWHVQVLGPLGIRHQQHGELTGARSRQLLTLLALHPQGLSGEDIYDSLVPDKVADPDSKRTYVKARISELRKLLGGGDTIAGRTHLPISSTAGTDRYRLVAIDIDTARFRQLLRQPDPQVTDLTAALDLVQGEIGAGEISWFPWITRTVHDLHVVIIDTGRRLATAALATGDPALADWAATQARLGVPYDQSLIPLAIQARTALGDRVGVRRLHDEIADTHNGDLATDVQAAFDRALATG